MSYDDEDGRDGAPFIGGDDSGLWLAGCLLIVVVIIVGGQFLGCNLLLEIVRALGRM